MYFQTISSCPKAATEREKTYNAFLEEDTANITKLINIVYNETGEVVTSDGLSAMYEKLLSEVWCRQHITITPYLLCYLVLGESSSCPQRRWVRSIKSVPVGNTKGGFYGFWKGFVLGFERSWNSYRLQKNCIIRKSFRLPINFEVYCKMFVGTSWKVLRTEYLDLIKTALIYVVLQKGLWTLCCVVVMATSISKIVWFYVRCNF